MYRARQFLLSLAQDPPVLRSSLRLSKACVCRGKLGQSALKALQDARQVARVIITLSAVGVFNCIYLNLSMSSEPTVLLPLGNYLFHKS